MFNHLVSDLTQLPQIEAIALGGSRAGSHFDEKSDYDVYLYCTAAIPEDIRQEILSKYCSYLEIGNHFWEYEDNCTLSNGIDIDILYRNLDDFAAEVAAVVEDFHARNAYTTCMWHNLKTCKILYDRDGRLAKAKQRFDVPYPEKLRENILSRNWQLLHSAMPAYELQILKAANRGDLVSVNHRLTGFLETYFDLLFSMNRQTHPGEKRLITLCRENCAVLPANFEENLQILFSHAFSDPQALKTDLERILAELAKILEK